MVDNRSGSHDTLGFLIHIIAVLIILGLSVLMSLIYVDILTAKHEVQEQVKAVDRLRKDVEKRNTAEEIQ